MFFVNIRKPFSSFVLISLFLIGIFSLSAIWWYFSDTRNMLGNHGWWHVGIDVVLSWCTIFLLPLLFVGILHRSWLLGKKPQNANSFLGVCGGIISVIISGSTCCGVTIASLLGFLPVLSFLPGSGLELKLLGVSLLFYSIYSLYSRLETCTLTLPRDQE